MVLRAHLELVQEQPLELRQQAEASQARRQVLPQASRLRELAQAQVEPIAELAEREPQGPGNQMALPALAGQMPEVAHSCPVAWEAAPDIPVQAHQKRAEDIGRAVQMPVAAENWAEPESQGGPETMVELDSLAEGRRRPEHRPAASQAADSQGWVVRLEGELGVPELPLEAPLPALEWVDLDGMDQVMTFRATHQDFKSFSLASKFTQRAIRKQAREAIARPSKSLRSRA